MTVRTIAGWTAVVSGGLLVTSMVAMTLAGWSGVVRPETGAASRSTTMMGSGTAMMPMAGMMPMSGGHMSGMGGMMHGTTASTGEGPIAGAVEVRVQVRNFGFDPNEIRLPKDRDVNITLANPTSVEHDLTVPALGIHLVAQPGTTRTFGVGALPAGRYAAYCSVPGHNESGMRATVIVE